MGELAPLIDDGSTPELPFVNMHNDDVENWVRDLSVSAITEEEVSELVSQDLPNDEGLCPDSNRN